MNAIKEAVSKLTAEQCVSLINKYGEQRDVCIQHLNSISEHIRVEPHKGTLKKSRLGFFSGKLNRRSSLARDNASQSTIQTKEIADRVSLLQGLVRAIENRSTEVGLGLG